MSTKNIIGIFVICFIVISITMAIIFRPQEKEDQPFITPYQVTIKNPYTTQAVTSESGYLVNETAEIFVVVPITVKNISDEEFIMFGDDFKLTVDGSDYSVSNVAVIMDKGFWASASLGAGIQKDFVLVFEIPLAKKDTAKKLKIKIGGKETRQEVNSTE